MQVSASHEWSESVTDPIPVAGYHGWLNEDFGGELADLCNTGTSNEYAEAAPGIYLAKVTDDYEWARFGVPLRCLISDPAPQKFSVATGSASIGVHTATLRGTINPAGWPAYFQFAFTRPGGTEYIPSRNENGSLWYGFASAGQGTGNTPVNVEVAGLKGNTSYSVRLDGVGALTNPVAASEVGYPKVMPGSTIQFTTPSWPPIVSTKPASSIQRNSAVLNGTVNPQGEPTTFYLEYGTTTAYGKAVPVPAENLGSGTQVVNVANVVNGLEESTKYHYRIKATNAEGTSFGADQSFTTPGIKPIYLGSFGSQGTGNGQFQNLNDSAVDQEGNVWVTDSNNSTVQKFNAAGGYLKKLGTGIGTGNGQIEHPNSIAIDPKGNIWLGNASSSRVDEFNAAGTFVRSFPACASGGLAVDAVGDVFTNCGGGTVQKWTETGTLQKTIGSFGTGPGQLLESGPIAVNASGTLWVGDSHWSSTEGWTSRIEKFNASGEYVSQFGSYGTGPGQFRRVAGLEIDGQGTILVADLEGDRIEEFSEAGGYFTQFGSQGAGEGQFVFGRNAGVSLDSKGDLYVLDANHYRVERWFNTVYAPVYTSSFGSQGTGNGQFQNVADSAVDSAGNVWVTDNNNSTVQKFNATGAYVKKLGTGVGTGNGQIEHPTSIAIDPKGNIWLANASGSRVDEFNSAGTFVRSFPACASGGLAVDAVGDVFTNCGGGTVQKWTETGTLQKTIGSWGTGPGQLTESGPIAVNANGTLWVGDSHWSSTEGWTSRIEKFNTSGEYVSQFGSYGTGPGQFRRVAGLEVDGQGTIFVADLEGDRVEEYTSRGEFVAQFGSQGAGEGQFVFSQHAGISSDSTGNLYILDANHYRVEKWVNTFYSPIYLGSFGSQGTGAGQFQNVADSAVDQAGNVWVTDNNSSTVQEFNASGAYVKKLGTGVGTGNGQIEHPTEIAIDSNSNIWLANASGSRVDEFNTAGTFVRSFPACASSGLAVDVAGDVFTSCGGGTVQEWTETGTLKNTIGSWGTGPGQLTESGPIAVNASGTLWVGDSHWSSTEGWTSRVEKFNTSGEYVSQFGSYGTGTGQFKRVAGLELDSDGDLFVGDLENDRVEEFNEVGGYVTQFGSKGSGAGQFVFSQNAGISLDSKGNIYVLDANHYRVERWWLHMS
jgi:sugar lactone lactonase YvrE